MSQREHDESDRGSAEHALAVRHGGRRVVRRATTKFVVLGNTESLCWWDRLVLQTMLDAAVEDSDTFHREQLKKGELAYRQ